MKSEPAVVDLAEDLSRMTGVNQSTLVPTDAIADLRWEDLMQALIEWGSHMVRKAKGDPAIQEAAPGEVSDDLPCRETSDGAIASGNSIRTATQLAMGLSELHRRVLLKTPDVAALPPWLPVQGNTRHRTMRTMRDNYDIVEDYGGLWRRTELGRIVATVLTERQAVTGWLRSGLVSESCDDDQERADAIDRGVHLDHAEFESETA